MAHGGVIHLNVNVGQTPNYSNDPPTDFTANITVPDTMSAVEIWSIVTARIMRFPSDLGPELGAVPYRLDLRNLIWHGTMADHAAPQNPGPPLGADSRGE